jgi:DNA-binding MarR family transcriptional regulator
MKWSRHQKTTLAMVTYRNLLCAADMMVRQLDQVLGSLKMTTGEYRALEALFFHGPMSQAELTRLTFTSGSSTSLAVSMLERDKLATRRADPSNVNKNVVTITREGKRTLARALPHTTKLVRALMAALDKREQMALARLCEKLAMGDEAALLRELLTTLREGRRDWRGSKKRKCAGEQGSRGAGKQSLGSAGL